MMEAVRVVLTPQSLVDMDERRRFLIKVTLFLRNQFRTEFGLPFSNKWGHFIDEYLSRQIHCYADWIEYPKGDHVFDEDSGAPQMCAVFSSDGYYLITGSVNRTISVWEISFDEHLYRKKQQWVAHDAIVSQLAYHCRGLLVSSSYDGIIHVWDAFADYKLVLTLDDHKGCMVSALAINAKGNRIISSGLKDINIIKLWSLDSIHKDREQCKGVCLKTFMGHTDRVNSLLFVNDELFLSGSSDSSIKLWNVSSDEESLLKNFNDGIIADKVVRQMSLNCDASLIAACVESNGLLILQWPKMDVLRVIDDFKDTVRCQFHPTRNDILAANDRRRPYYCIRVYSVRDGKCLSIFKGHEGPVSCLKFSPDGHRLVSTSIDMSVRVWDLDERTELDFN